MSESAVVLALRVLGAALALGFNLVLARRLGADGMGMFTLALTLLTVTTTVAQLGLNLVIVRFVAEASSRSSWQDARLISRFAQHRSSRAALVLTFALLLLADPIAVGLFSEPDLASAIRLMALTILPFTLLVLQGEALKGARRLAAAQMTQSVIGPAIALVIVLALTTRLTLSWSIGSFFAGILLALGVSRFWWWRTAGRPVPGPLPDAHVLDQARSMARPLFGTAILALLMSSTDAITLGIWHGSEDVGVYFVASRLTLVSSMALSAVGSAIGPRFAALWIAQRTTELRSLVVGVTGLMAFAACVMCGVFVIYGARLLSLFGDEYEEGATVLAILAVGQLVVLASGPASNLLVMTGRERIYRNATIVGALLNVCLSLALVPAHGAIGAAIATAAGLVAVNLLAALSVWWRSGIMTMVQDELP